MGILILKKGTLYSQQISSKIRFCIFLQVFRGHGIFVRLWSFTYKNQSDIPYFSFSFSISQKTFLHITSIPADYHSRPSVSPISCYDALDCSSITCSSKSVSTTKWGKKSKSLKIARNRPKSNQFLEGGDMFLLV